MLDKALKVDGITFYKPYTTPGLLYWQPFLQETALLSNVQKTWSGPQAGSLAQYENV